MTEELSLWEKLRALYLAGTYRPSVTVGIILLSLLAAALEAIGLSFLLPIIKLAQNTSTNTTEGGGWPLRVFRSIYEFVGLPFTLELVIVGVSLVITVRYLSSFLVSWLRAAFKEKYIQYLMSCAFENALNANTSYFDREGSDEILNTIVTQSNYAGAVIKHTVKFIEQAFISMAYISIALFIEPVLTVAAGVLLGVIAGLLRYLLQSGYAIGDRVANANERVQKAVQAGTQGIRDVKLFNMIDELLEDFDMAINQAVSSRILLTRNKAALNNIYQLVTAVTVFLLVYTALTVFSLSLASLGVFLFAMFRLAPRVGNLNNVLYEIDGNLPHLFRTQEFINELEFRSEEQSGTESIPDTIEAIVFENVSFSYDTGEEIFDGLSLTVEQGEFAAFVGPSGAGKSTIVSLLTRLYEPDAGEIQADGIPIDQFDIQEWRSRVSVVRQHPFIFNETLRRNVTIADREATQAEIERVCEIAQVTEFVDDLPNSYETVLGDDGVRLSGGQKQRIALARALLKDADFLVLDEATSDLDSNIEETVHTAIESMERDYAMLVIAHRLSTVRNADTIYTIEDGTVVESGSHEQLLGSGGTYADLHEIQ